MNNILNYAIELALYLLITLLAFMITRSLHFKSQVIRRTLIEHKRWVRGVLGHIALPAVVILVSYLFLWVTEWCPQPMHIWMDRRESHFDAWLAFWSIALAVRAIEALAVCSFWAKGREFPVPELLLSILRGIIILLAAFIIMKEMLGVNIAPLLASTALVTAVIGFALQGVLGNLLGGMSLNLVRSLVPGDWVAIDDVEGKVIETNWRETRLRTIDGHMMVIPNSRVASSTLNNMTWPTAQRRHRLEVGASYSDAPGDVIKELEAAARAIHEVLDDPPPSAVVKAYLDFGINYELRYWTNRYYDRAPVDGAVGRMIWYRFKRKGIEIPFPMSDKLLNDFMAVVYNQRKLPPQTEDIESMAANLAESDFARILCCDQSGKPLLGEKDYNSLAGVSRRVQYTAGEHLFNQEDSGDSCYVLVSGKMRGIVRKKERPMHEFDIKPGALVGEMSLLTGAPRTASVLCVTDCILIEISKNTFMRLLSIKPEIPEQLASLVEKRAGEIKAVLDETSAQPVASVEQELTKRPILRRFLRMIGKEQQGAQRND